jgi:hypothetical protein
VFPKVERKEVMLEFWVTGNIMYETRQSAHGPLADRNVEQALMLALEDLEDLVFKA